MSQKSEYTIRPLRMQDLHQVSQIHRMAFPDSALTHLGIEPIRRYYEWQLIGPHDCYAIGSYEEDKLVGFCFAGLFRGSLSGYINQNKSFLIKWILLHPWLILNPLVVERISVAIHSIRKTQIKKINPPQTSIPKYGILSIAVNPTKQGRGIGKMIMREVEENAKQNGCFSIQLTVHPTNTQAIYFYEETGWTKKINGSETWTGLMEKILTNDKNDH